MFGRNASAIGNRKDWSLGKVPCDDLALANGDRRWIAGTNGISTPTNKTLSGVGVVLLEEGADLVGRGERVEPVRAKPLTDHSCNNWRED